jgi:hypothetical protein
MMSSGDAAAKKKRIVDCEDAKCVWKLECPFCGWPFGFCLDLTDVSVNDDLIFFLNGIKRTPTRFPKRESGHTYAYFKVRSRKCGRCRTIMIPEDNLSDWLVSRGIENKDFDEIEALLLEADPDGLLAMICSDRVYDAQFEEWGVNGMPSRYVAIRGSSRFQKKLVALLRSRA